MKRVERGGLVIHVDRSRGWSFLFLFSSVVALLVGWELLQRNEMDCFALMLVGAVALAAVAMGLLLRARAFIIDRAAGTLAIRERRPFQPSKERLYPLDKVEVELERNQITHHYSTRSGQSSKIVVTEKLWIVIKGSNERISFLSDVRGLVGQALADQLAGDLGCKWGARGWSV